jgi:Protein of unknown function (DUF2637)
MTLTPVQYSKAQRRFLSTLGGLGVLALAAGTFVLSYDDLRLLALRGGAARRWAYLYPGMLDGLVVVIILAIFTARRSGWFARSVRWLLLVILIVGAGAASVQRAVKGYAALPDTWVNVGVAVAPWTILIIAVWLWISMIKQMLGLRKRRRRGSGDALESGVPAGPVEPVPATVVDKAIIPGFEPAETKPLPRPTSIRELEPVREPVPAGEAESDPWDAALLKTPEPWEGARPSGSRDDEYGPVEPSDPVPPSWGGGGEPTPSGDGHTEPRDPVPASWAPEPDAPDAPDTRDTADASEPQPLLPPAPRHDGLHAETVDAPAEDPIEPDPEPQAEAPMNDKPAEPAEEEPSPRLVARTTLPTDVRLVGGPQRRPALTDTQPDGIKLPDTNPDGIPIVGTAAEEEDDDGYADERAEDPDAGEDTTSAGQWPGEDMESTPPSSKFRSSPTPPRD